MKKILNFLSTNWLLVLVFIGAILANVLVGISVISVLVVAIFLVIVSYLKGNRKFATAGTALFWIVVGVFGYYTVSHWLTINFTESVKVYPRFQKDKDIRIAKEMNPELLYNDKALLDHRIRMQDSLGLLFDQALAEYDYDRADKILETIENQTSKLDSMETKVFSVKKKLKRQETKDTEFGTRDRDKEQSSIMFQEFKVHKNIVTDLISVPDNVTIYFESEKPFLLLEFRDLNYRNKLTEVSMPAGASSRYTTWGGVVQVKSKEENKISVGTMSR